MAFLTGINGSLTGVPFSRGFAFSAKQCARPGARILRLKSFFNPSDEPILKEALKEPVAFLGGVFAGLLRLDLNEEPLKDWISRAVEAARVTEEDVDAGSTEEEAVPQPIEIE